MITQSDLTHMQRLNPTKEVTTPLSSGFDTVVVYDVEITDDPTGTNTSAYAITIPGEMNYDDVSKTRKKRLAFVMGMWYIQNEKRATVLIQQDLLPNTMQANKNYAITLTEDHELGRPHLYHPADTRYTYPYNVGSEIEDDREKNNKPSKWDNIKQTLRNLFNAKWTKIMTLLGMLFVIIILVLLGPILGACLPGVVSGSVTTVTCPDGSQCEQFLYLGADCVTYTYYCCTGEMKGGTGPPAGLPNILPWAIGGGLVLILAIGGLYLLTRRKEKMGGAPVIYSLGGGYAPPAPPPVGVKA